MAAERWLGRLERHAEQDPSGIILTTECYQLVIEAWAGAEKEDPARAVTRGERWLLKHSESTIPHLRPTTDTFNAFLDLCSRGRAFKNSPNKELVKIHAQTAERALLYMIADRKKHGSESTIAPNTQSFNFVIRAWTRCRRSYGIADHCMDTITLLDDYQATVDSSVRPDSRSYGMAMDSIAVLGRLKVKRYKNQKKENDDPSENGLAEIRQLEQILGRLRKNGVLPTTHNYNILISAWANVSAVNPRAPMEAESVLQRMIALKDQGEDQAAPDSLTYTTVMRAWANGRAPNRGKRVQWWLDKQWKDFFFEGRADLQPNTKSYNMVIRVWSDLGQPVKAERALSQLLDHSSNLSSNPNDPSIVSIAPSSESFAFVIRAWLVVAENGSREALLAAVKWLDSLSELERKDDAGVVTSVELYSSSLGVARKCAHVCPDVLDTAVELFDKLRDSHHEMDALHYSRLLQVGLLALARPENDKVRTAFARQVTSDCCDAGLMSSAFLRALSNGAIFYTGWTLEESLLLVDELFPDWPLPASSMRNIKQEGFMPKRSDLMRTRIDISPHGIDPYKQ
jgi:hypothetical protein